MKYIKLYFIFQIEGVCVILFGRHELLHHIFSHFEILATHYELATLTNTAHMRILRSWANTAVQILFCASF